MVCSDPTAPFIAAWPGENRNVSVVRPWMWGPAPKLLHQMTNFTNGPRHWCEVSSAEGMSCFPKELICCPAEGRPRLQKYRAGFCSSTAAWVERCWPRVPLPAGVRWKIGDNLWGWCLALSETESFAGLLSPGNRDQTLAVPAAPRIARLLHASGARAEHHQAETRNTPGRSRGWGTAVPLPGMGGRSCGWAEEESAGSLQSCAPQPVHGWAAGAGGGERWWEGCGQSQRSSPVGSSLCRRAQLYCCLRPPVNYHLIQRQRD